MGGEIINGAGEGYSRRTLLRGTALAGLAASCGTLLSACTTNAAPATASAPVEPLALPLSDAGGRMMKITRIDSFRTKLGEGPLWDARNQVLYGVDHLGRSIWRYDPANDRKIDWKFDEYVMCLALCDGQGDRAIVALQSGLYQLDLVTQRKQLIADICSANENTQLNDGKVDRNGRFVIGSVDVHSEPFGALYLVDRSFKVTTIDTGFQISNGPCWSPDGRTLYVAETATGDIFAYDYNNLTGIPSGRRLFANTLQLGGVPDGATVDSNGYLWSAILGAGKVARFSPNGDLERTVELPTPLISSVMFGGPNLDRLFVTSIDGGAAALEIEAARKNPVPSDPSSGALFVIDGIGVQGLPEPYFKTDPDVTDTRGVPLSG